MSIWLALAALGALGTSLAGCGSDPANEPHFPPAAEPPHSPPLRSEPAGRVVRVGREPEGIVADRRTGIVAVGLRKPDRLALLAGASGAVARRVALPESPRHLSLARPGGPVLVPAERADSLIEVDLRSGRTRATPVGNFPHDAAAVGARTFVGDEMEDTVTVVEHGRVVKRLRVAEQPGGVTATGTGEVAVVAVRERVIETFDARTFERTGRVAAGKGPTHVVSDGRGHLFVADTQGRALLRFVTEPALRLTRTVRLGAAPYGIAIDRRRARIWLTLPGRNRLVAHALTARMPRVASIPTIRQPNTVSVDEASGRVLVAGRSRGLLQILWGAR